MQQQTLDAGDSLRFVTSTPQFPASAGWVLKYRLVPRFTPGNAIEIVCSAQGDDHLAAVPASTTASWAAGEYGWASWVEGGTAEVYRVDRGQITIAPNPRTLAAGADTRSATEIALANVDAMLQGKATSGTRRYRIGDRELESYAATELLQLRSQLVVQLKRERRAQALAEGRPDPFKFYVRLNRE